MGVSENSGTPQIIHFNRVFHYKPSILGYHYFRKHPYRFSLGFPDSQSKQPIELCGWMWAPVRSLKPGGQRCKGFHKEFIPYRNQRQRNCWYAMNCVRSAVTFWPPKLASATLIISSPEHCPFQCLSKVAPSSESSDAPHGDGEPHGVVPKETTAPFFTHLVATKSLWHSIGLVKKGGPLASCNRRRWYEQPFTTPAKKIYTNNQPVLVV